MRVMNVMKDDVAQCGISAYISFFHVRRRSGITVLFPVCLCVFSLCACIYGAV